MQFFTALKLLILVLVLLERISDGESSRGGSRGSGSSRSSRSSSSKKGGSNRNTHQTVRMPGGEPSRGGSRGGFRRPPIPSPPPRNRGPKQNTYPTQTLSTSAPAILFGTHHTGSGKQPSYNTFPQNSGPYSKLPNGASAPTSHNNHPNSPYPSGHNPPYPVGQASHPFPQTYPPSSGSHVPNSHPFNTHPLPPPGISVPSTPNQGNSPSGGSYHLGGGSHHPGGQSYPTPPPQPHYAPPTQAFVPGRTVNVEKPSKGPGLGTHIASGVAGGAAAGATGVIVDRAISRIFLPNHNHIQTYPSAPPVGTPTSTHTVNNYYYGNQPSPQPQQNSGNAGKGTPTNGLATRTPEAVAQAEKNDPLSDTNIMKLTEELFVAQDKNVYPLLELNLQKRGTPSSNPSDKVPDEAPERLFTSISELDSMPTVTALRALYDQHERDGTKAENLTPERKRKEATFIEEIMKTPVMMKAMDWLSSQNYVEPRDSEKKDTLKRMWFSVFDKTSSGFERIFLSEKFGNNGIVGMQNWLYFAHLESQDKVNYLGYVDTANLGGKGQLLKLNYLTDGFTMQNATILVGTPPELELALYTICFYARPNNWCPVSLGGSKFFILTHHFQYYQKKLIDLAFPAF